MENFRGYYFKCSSKEKTAAFIAAVHANSASVQIITDSAACCVNYDAFSLGSKAPRIKIGDSVFSENGIKLSINNKSVNAGGILKFGRSTPLHYDVMGPFKIASPLLQCRHRVISMRHLVNGTVIINGEKYVFSDGLGYIEGDEGTSFSHSYLWTQCFFDGGSLMLSAADVPLFGTSFRGIIGAVCSDGRELRFGTYLGARAIGLEDGFACIKQGSYILTVKRLSENNHRLLAPEKGSMNRVIRESASCDVYCRLEKKGRVLLEFISSQGSFECERI